MRAGLAIILLLSVGFFVAAMAGTRNRNYSHFVKHRTRPREIRGFKPEYISTAIGFGKREDPLELSRLDRDEKVSSLVDNFSRDIPVEWLLREMKVNPEFAGRVTQALMGTQLDLSMMDQSQEQRTGTKRKYPVRNTWVTPAALSLGALKSPKAHRHTSDQG
ncbi:hypothetical protein KM043_007607 [Ampulex compressa]|nr:hypothetical protein KM043_007607 [Ampulex compressa]